MRPLRSKTVMPIRTVSAGDRDGRWGTERGFQTTARLDPSLSWEATTGMLKWDQGVNREIQIRRPGVKILKVIRWAAALAVVLVLFALRQVVRPYAPPRGRDP